MYYDNENEQITFSNFENHNKFDERISLPLLFDVLSFLKDKYNTKISFSNNDDFSVKILININNKKYIKILDLNVYSNLSEDVFFEIGINILSDLLFSNDYGFDVPRGNINFLNSFYSIYNFIDYNKLEKWFENIYNTKIDVWKPNSDSIKESIEIMKNAFKTTHIFSKKYHYVVYNDTTNKFIIYFID